MTYHEEDKIMGITTDNASNNSTFMTSLSIWAAENVVNFNKKEQHIRCFAPFNQFKCKRSIKLFGCPHLGCSYKMELNFDMIKRALQLKVKFLRDVIGNDKEDDDDEDDDEENEENNEKNNGRK
ncbi:uncharacterized protein OCT59_021826 [Rhizophagus irregularis]|uniref:uncharacterized protein n=1 Tax=Rhizophagus irregularis TaxID=588596 RepID=UPI003323F191|nr:hypothetical protein OCT59_021826 [Rhizophagus irregularis]